MTNTKVALVGLDKFDDKTYDPSFGAIHIARSNGNGRNHLLLNGLEDERVFFFDPLDGSILHGRREYIRSNWTILKQVKKVRIEVIE